MTKQFKRIGIQIKQYGIIFFISICFQFYGFSQNLNHSKNEIKYFKSFDGLKIAYVDQGSGTPVLFLHGFINTGANWYNTPTKKRLIALGYRVIIPDMRGNGKSDKPISEKFYKNDAEVKDLKGLMDFLGVDNYNLIAYSRGSIIGAKLLTEDQRIEKAVLGGMGIDFTNPKWSNRINFAKALIGSSKDYPWADGAKAYAKKQGANLKVLHWLQVHQPITSKESLSRVKAKVLVIAGDQDKDNGDPKFLKEVFKRSVLSIVPGVHNTTYHQEDFANQIVLFFE